MSETNTKPTNVQPAAILSALRTLASEHSGIEAVQGAMSGPLGTSFAEAVDLIRQESRLTSEADQGHLVDRFELLDQ